MQIPSSGLIDFPEIFGQFVTFHIFGVDAVVDYQDHVVLHCPTGEIHDSRQRCLLDWLIQFNVASICQKCVSVVQHWNIRLDSHNYNKIQESAKII